MGGVLVEPDIKSFELLKRNYNGMKNLQFENSAISNKDGDINFYISPNNMLSSLHNDEWFKGRNYGKSYDRRISLGGSKLISINSMTLKSLLLKYDIKGIDLLQIDTEGYDLEILKQIDFRLIKPKMICFEHHHFSQEEIQPCYESLRNSGYSIMKIGMDTFAYL